MFDHDHTQDMSYYRDGEVRCDQCDRVMTAADLTEQATYHLGLTYLWLQQGEPGGSTYTVGIAARAQA